MPPAPGAGGTPTPFVATPPRALLGDLVPGGVTLDAARVGDATLPPASLLAHLHLRSFEEGYSKDNAQ